MINFHDPIVITSGIIGGIGFACATTLALAARFLAVKEDPRVEAMEEIMPGANCGGCGYAGWGAGQLDREIQEESWWLGPLDELLLLDLDYELRWERTMDNLGFDPLTTTFSQTGMV